MSWRYFQKPKMSREHMYGVLLSPVITEKSTLGSEHNQVTFRVPLTPLPQLVGAVLATGLKIERIELREPDLTDVFTLFTGHALGTEKENA